MPSVSQQLTLTLDPSVIERWPTLRQFIAHRVDLQVKLAKTIAADMDLSPGTLAKKLIAGEDYTNRFNVDDLEGYLASTGDTPAIIEYLATKFMSGGDEARRARAVATIESLLPDLTKALATIKREGAKR